MVVESCDGDIQLSWLWRVVMVMESCHGDGELLW